MRRTTEGPLFFLMMRMSCTIQRISMIAQTAIRMMVAGPIAAKAAGITSPSFPNMAMLKLRLTVGFWTKLPANSQRTAPAIIKMMPIMEVTITFFFILKFQFMKN